MPIFSRSLDLATKTEQEIEAEKLDKIMYFKPSPDVSRGGKEKILREFSKKVPADSEGRLRKAFDGVDILTLVSSPLKAKGYSHGRGQISRKELMEMVAVMMSWHGCLGLRGKKSTFSITNPA